ncbi:MAG: RICIN domain-containing protein [Chitinophagaceae bacterium]
MKKSILPQTFRKVIGTYCKSVTMTFLFICAVSLISYSQGFRVSGNQLLDANGNNFVMKGFSVPTAWFTSDVNNNITNMKNRTGANCLRIVVTTSTSDAAWQTSVANCIANKIIPMVELHDVTGNNSPSELNRMAQFWASKASYFTRPEIAKYILINIANEWGDWFMSATATGTVSRVTWRDAYKTAVKTIRDAGIRTTLVIDAAGYGQDNRTQTLLSYAKEVQASDVNHNCIFAIHMYCEWKVGGNSAISLLPGVKNAGIPVIVGEFGFQHTEGGSVCDINESQIISTANSNGIGWVAWSWKGNGGGVEYLDLSNDWGGTSLSGWGNTVIAGSGGTRTAVNASVFSTTSNPTIANGTYRIIARHSGKSLNVQNSSTADGGNVIQGPYTGGNNQRWFVQSLGSGAYSIRNVNGSKSLDVSGASTADGADINQWTYSGNNNQRWRIESVGSGFYRIVSVNSGKCVDIVGASTADNAAINQWPCNGGNNQSFTFEQLSTTSARSAVPATEEVEEETLIPLSVYPNPSAHNFTVYQSGTFTYTITDINGKVIANRKAVNKANFGQELSKGMYLLQVRSEGKVRSVKVIKN